MRIQHNILAMNAYRNYNSNTSALSKNLEKLSSGYKINRAGDDAAGLAISEKMRAQITGLGAAQKNVKDGISLVKTAEGAMQEIQDMLNRMDYLATQSANGTYDDPVDRLNLQKEVDALKTEINRIADSANFNGINLLDGSLEQSSGGKTEISGTSRIISSVVGSGEKSYEVTGFKTVLDSSAAKATKGSFTVDLNSLQFTNIASTAGKTGSVTITVGGVALKAASASVAAGAITQATVQTDLAKAIASANSTVMINDIKWNVTQNGTKLTFTQATQPVTKQQAQCNFDVSVDYDGPTINSTATKGIKLDASELHGTQVVKQAVAAEGANMANTTFKIDASDIKDGTVIKIGDRSVTLKVGAESTMQAKGTSTLVDLSSMEEGNIDLNVALGKISVGLGSTTQIDGKLNNGTSGKFTFNIGVSDGADGKAVGITINRTQAMETTTAGHGAYFSTKDRLASAFSMSVQKKASSGLTLQIGDTSDSFNQLSVAVGDMHVSAMKSASTGKSIGDIDISTREGASEAIKTIKDAINYVSGVRGDLGAVQNRLEHTQNNLSVMSENIQDAESTIRDTDIADEMMAYTKNNILIQSAQAMLAQANAVPQGVLQLLG